MTTTYDKLMKKCEILRNHGYTPCGHIFQSSDDPTARATITDSGVVQWWKTDADGKMTEERPK